MVTKPNGMWVPWLVLLMVLLIPFPVSAQGAGIWSRLNCTEITSPVNGETFCFDQTLNALFIRSGGAWVRVTLGTTASQITFNSNVPAPDYGLRIIANGGGTGFSVINNSTGVSAGGVNILTSSTGTPALRSEGLNYYAGYFQNLANPVPTSNGSAVVATSIYGYTAFLQQGEDLGTLAANSENSVLYAVRNTALGGFDFTAPLVRIEDATAATGDLLRVIKQGDNTLRIRRDGLMEQRAILAVTAAGGTVDANLIGIELRGAATPNLLAYNRNTAAYLPMVYDALSHTFNVSGTTQMTIGPGLVMSGANIVTLGSVLQANLGTPANGTIIYCSDCNTASACTAGGTGALASRQNGAWKCL